MTPNPFEAIARLKAQQAARDATRVSLLPPAPSGPPRRDPGTISATGEGNLVMGLLDDKAPRVHDAIRAAQRGLRGLLRPRGETGQRAAQVAGLLGLSDPLSAIDGPARAMGIVGRAGAGGLLADDVLQAAAQSDEGVRLMLDRGAWKMVRTAEDIGPGRVNYRVVPTNTEGLEQSGRFLFDPRKAHMDGGAVRPRVGSEQIPAVKQDGVLYRGMSAEEYAEFQRTGQIQSRGHYNLTGQENTTSFALDPQDAAGYAVGAPAAFKPTFDRPAYVVAIRAPEETARRQLPGMDPTYEVSVVRPISKDEVVGAWRGDVYAVRTGDQDLTQSYGQWRRSSGSQPTAYVTWAPIEP